MLRLEKLQLKNFISYKDQVVDFNQLFADNNILLIYGKNLDDISFASDNGAGKSILYQAILFTLTGRTTRGTSPDLLVGKFAKSMSCTLEITDSDNNNIWIRRYRKHANFGNDVRLKVNGKEVKKGKSREMTTYLLNFLTLSYRRIINTSIFESDDERSRFIYLNDKDGKALLSQIKGLEIFQKCFEIAKEQTSEIEQKIEEISNAIAISKNTIEQNKQFLKETENAYNEVDAQTQKEVAYIKQQIANEDKAIARQSNLFRNEIKTCKRDIKEIKKTIYKAKSLKALETKRKTIADSIQEYKNNVTITQNGIYYNQKTLALLKDNKSKIGKTCDFCGGIISGEHLKKHIATTETFIKMESLNAKLMLEKMFALTKRQNKIESKINENEQKIKENVAKRAKIDTLNARIRECLQLLVMASKNYSKTVQEFESRIKEVSKRKNQYAKTIADIKERTAKLKQNLSELSNQQRVMNKKHRYRHAWFLGFGKEGLQTSALKSTVKELNDEITRISEILTDGTIEIKLVTEKVLRSKKVRNLFEFEISDSNKKNLPFKEWSKGQKKRIEIIVSFALMSIEDSVISEVFLDELFDGIDEVGINKIKALLDNEAQMKSRRFVLFSHSKEIKDLFTNRAYVKLENGLSTLHKEN